MTFFLTPLFAQVDYFGGLTNGYRLGLTLQNQGEVAILWPACRACMRILHATSSQLHENPA